MLDVENHPLLLSHVIGGKPVLPMAMILEWLAHGALHDNPGLLLHGLDEFRVLKGVVLEDGPMKLRVLAARASRVDGSFEVETELRSSAAGGREFIHARAKVLLATRLPEPPAWEMHEGLCERRFPVGVDAIYRDIIFHGPLLQALERIEGLSGRGMVATVAGTAPPPDKWMTQPVRTAWLSDPLAVDAGLQLGLIWSHEELGAVSLPSYVARFRQYGPFPRAGVTITLEIREADPRRMVGDLTFLDAEGRVVARAEGQEWTVDPTLRSAFDQNVAAGV